MIDKTGYIGCEAALGWSVLLKWANCEVCDCGGGENVEKAHTG